MLQVDFIREEKRVGKNRSVVAWGSNRTDCSQMRGISYPQDGNVLKFDCGDGCTTLQIY